MWVISTEKITSGSAVDYEKKQPPTFKDSHDPAKTNRHICSGRPEQPKSLQSQWQFQMSHIEVCPSACFCSFTGTHTPCLGRKCLDWLVGTAAPHRKWRLHSFPSACRWSLILVQLSGTSTKRWNPAAELYRILYHCRETRYRSSTNQSWITRDCCTTVKSFN